ncbi:hypothetical protein [Streptomyces antarcticus]|uniref:hypothetical protein n=1 Tax=Streptomyces antarcticus TaxID=2996458 RepID=UPI00226EEAA7|nr:MULTISPECIES: hypothetical protein [unclassified Streptomyces]MCY0942350.1 hypothetical protein [Streptomyces sp. H34-AA3]MCZ4080653.1 hypothetical protein [Streptomyces sp. H34-S5]
MEGNPSFQLPLLLAAYQYRFGGDLEAMSRHLIDDVTVGWDYLGTDLLDRAPQELLAALTGGEPWSSHQPENLFAFDGSPPVRMTVTPHNTSELEWGYVLHTEGIEVISLYEQDRGPLIGWTTSPLSPFSDHPAKWQPLGPPPGQTPRTAPALTTTPVAASPPATASRSRAARL